MSLPELASNQKVGKLDGGNDRPVTEIVRRPGLNDQRKWDERFAKDVIDYDADAAAVDDWRYCSVGEKLGFPDPVVVDDLGLARIIQDHAPNLYRTGSTFARIVKAKFYGNATELHDVIQENFDDEAEKVREEIDKKYYDCDPAVNGCDCDGCLEDDS